MSTNTVKPHQACLLLPCKCNLYVRWSSATPCRELLNNVAAAATNIPAGQVQLKQAPLPFKHAYCCKMDAFSLRLNQHIPDRKRNARLTTVQLSGRSQVIGQLSYINAKVCQVLLRHTSYVIRRRNSVKENWS